MLLKAKIGLRIWAKSTQLPGTVDHDMLQWAGTSHTFRLVFSFQQVTMCVRCVSQDKVQGNRASSYNHDRPRIRACITTC